MNGQNGNLKNGHNGDSRRNVALITGITGQDGSYLAELLLQKGYEVHGLIRPCSVANTKRIRHILKDSERSRRFFLHQGDMTDRTSLVKVLTRVRPSEIYNFAAQPHVKVSETLPEYTAEVTGVGVLRLLEVITDCGLQKETRFLQASTSELFGKADDVPQTEETPFAPRSPYGVAKLFGHWSVVNFRESHQAFAVNALSFNHESPRRGTNFVTRKITRSVAKIHLGLQDRIELGNLDSMRDWGHARDYVECMWRILQLEDVPPQDFVIATGELHSVRQFVEAAFRHVGVEIEWRGKGVGEHGVEKGTDKVRVSVNPVFYRPLEANMVVGDPAKVKAATGWTAKTGFDTLVKEMLEADLEEVRLNPDE